MRMELTTGLANLATAFDRDLDVEPDVLWPTCRDRGWLGMSVDAADRRSVV